MFVRCMLVYLSVEPTRLGYFQIEIQFATPCLISDGIPHFEGFSLDLCRSMVAMKDADLSGKLNFSDFQNLAKDLLMCKVGHIP